MQGSGKTEAKRSHEPDGALQNLKHLFRWKQPEKKQPEKDLKTSLLKQLSLLWKGADLPHTQSRVLPQRYSRAEYLSGKFP